MRVHFFKGIVRGETGRELVVHWASTGSGIVSLLEGAADTERNLNIEQVVDVERVATVDLPGLDEEMRETVIRGILLGGYLERPGVRDREDAALFAMLNEALQKLENQPED